MAFEQVALEASPDGSLLQNSRAWLGGHGFGRELVTLTSGHLRAGWGNAAVTGRCRKHTDCPHIWRFTHVGPEPAGPRSLKVEAAGQHAPAVDPVRARAANVRAVSHLPAQQAILHLARAGVPPEERPRRRAIENRRRLEKERDPSTSLRHDAEWAMFWGPNCRGSDAHVLQCGRHDAHSLGV